jgi:hypothetical protein
MRIVPRLTGWRRALAIILGAQLLFWGAYALIVAGLQPAGTLERYRLPAARVLLASEQGKSSAFAARPWLAAGNPVSGAGEPVDARRSGDGGWMVAHLPGKLLPKGGDRLCRAFRPYEQGG